MANKNILLIEPGYKNKYPPLGLMKLLNTTGHVARKTACGLSRGKIARFYPRHGSYLHHDAILLRVHKDCANHRFRSRSREPAGR